MAVLIARAPLILGGLVVGATGALTPVGGYAPQLERALFDAWASGDVDSARDAQARIAIVSQILHSTRATVSFNTKVLLAAVGLLETAMSPHPFGALDGAEQRGLVRAARQAVVLPASAAVGRAR